MDNFPLFWFCQIPIKSVLPWFVLIDKVVFLVKAWDWVLVLVDHSVDPVHHQEQFQYSFELNFLSHSPSVHRIGDRTALVPPSDIQSLVIVVVRESFVVHVIHDYVPINFQSIHLPRCLGLSS